MAQTSGSGGIIRMLVIREADTTPPYT